MANRFNGSYRNSHGKMYGTYGNRGVREEAQLEKHAEAVERNSRTVPTRRRAYRVGRTA